MDFRVIETKRKFPSCECGEMPVFKRCCFCVPMRYGLIIWGYVKLLVGLGLMCFLTLLWILLLGHGDRFALCYLTPLMTLLATDVVFTIMFIVGAHKKNLKIFRVYYYFSMLEVIATIILCSILITFKIIHLYEYFNNATEIFLALCEIMGPGLPVILMQSYMIVLLRSEIFKLRGEQKFRFVNNAAEAECTLDLEYDKDKEKDIDNHEKDQPGDTVQIIQDV